jgi:hypothetical protein
MLLNYPPLRIITPHADSALSDGFACEVTSAIVYWP